MGGKVVELRVICPFGPIVFNKNLEKRNFSFTPLAKCDKLAQHIIYVRDASSLSSGVIARSHAGSTRPVLSAQAEYLKGGISYDS